MEQIGLLECVKHSSPSHTAGGCSTPVEALTMAMTVARPAAAVRARPSPGARSPMLKPFERQSRSRLAHGSQTSSPGTPADRHACRGGPSVQALNIPRPPPSLHRQALRRRPPGRPNGPREASHSRSASALRPLTARERVRVLFFAAASCV